MMADGAPYTINQPCSPAYHPAAAGSVTVIQTKEGLVRQKHQRLPNKSFIPSMSNAREKRNVWSSGLVFALEMT